ncbi:GMP synthase (glutamine-hydrolysing) [Lysinibacter cavernae]|uniref:GMP synthase [glutamine-hydrolyzing] n=1 Tax=Lysinibacter cavernae TaxID=1640652 RepID=A0A7X5R1T2_9MICO|nr:GMP synthase (glutamine-hydrolysing) [Lysinibacter cavernae]
MPHTITAAEVAAKNPLGLVLSGGPSSVYAEGAPSLDPEVFNLGVPVLGICYGFQIMARTLGGTVSHTGEREYGATDATISHANVLVDELPTAQNVWMSHGDSVSEAPAGFTVLASTASTPVAAFAHDEKRLYGVQWHPEVKHSDYGQKLLENFLHRAAGIPNDWNPDNVIADQVASIQAQVGSGKVICGLSGGVDSAVAAALVHKAVGDQLVCVFVDHGLLRQDERRQVEEDYVTATGVRLVTVDAREQFLTALAGVTDPETKRKIIGREFIRTFEKAQADLIAEAKAEDGDPIKFLVQGTLYPDVVESGGGSGTANIKSHHNVGGLPEDLNFELVEPLRTLFKDEVRAIGRELGLPEVIVGRQPFPGPGLGIRIVGEVTAERLELLRAADAIAREELTAAGLDNEIWQCPVVLLADVRSVGVQGDGRTYGHPIVLRPVSSEDAMTADWTRLPYDVLARISNRITNQVPGVNRVVLDVTSKPPGTIEWE